MPTETLHRDMRNAFEDIDDFVDISGFLGKGSLESVMAEYFTDSAYLPKIHEFIGMKGHDEATYRHSLRVGALSWIALKMMESNGNRYSRDEMAEFCAAGILHDCGKIDIEKKILQTKGRIPKESYDEIKKHARKGVPVVRKILERDGINTMLIEQIAEHHHEDLNGNGYHNLLDAKIFNGYVQLVALADIIDSVICRGIYQGKCSPNDAMNYIELISTDGRDKANISYLAKCVSAVKDNAGRDYFKDAVPGRFDMGFAMPYIHLFRNHSRQRGVQE